MKLFRSLTFFALCAAVISCQKNDPGPQPIKVVANLQASFTFDGNLTDSKNYLVNPVVTGKAIYATGHNAQSDSSLYFDGTTKIIFPNLAVNGKAVTISAWVKYVSTNSGLQIFLRAADNNAGGFALTQVSKTFGFVVSVPGSNAAISKDVDAGWHHLAATYDSVNIKLYVDGALTTTTNHPGSMSSGNRQLIIGFFNGEYWKGYIDDLKIYDRALSANEISSVAKY